MSDWDLVRGNPAEGNSSAVRSAAGVLDRVAENGQRAHGELAAVQSHWDSAMWTGEAADAFFASLGEAPGDLEKLVHSYQQAAGALSWWAGRLEHHQGEARRALAKARRAHDDLRSASQRRNRAEGRRQDAARRRDAAQWRHRQAQIALLNPALDDASRHVHERSRDESRWERDRCASEEAAAQRERDNAAQAVDDAATLGRAARRLANQVRDLKERDATVTAQRLKAASESGIQPPGSPRRTVLAAVDSRDAFKAVHLLVSAGEILQRGRLLDRLIRAGRAVAQASPASAGWHRLIGRKGGLTRALGAPSRFRLLTGVSTVVNLVEIERRRRAFGSGDARTWEATVDLVGSEMAGRAVPILGPLAWDTGKLIGNHVVMPIFEETSRAMTGRDFGDVLYDQTYPDAPGTPEEARRRVEETRNPWRLGKRVVGGYARSARELSGQIGGSTWRSIKGIFD